MSYQYNCNEKCDYYKKNKKTKKLFKAIANITILLKVA